MAPDLEVNQPLVVATALEDGQPIPAPDPLPLADQGGAVVGVGGKPGIVMLENYQLTEPTQTTAGVHHFSGG